MLTRAGAFPGDAGLAPAAGIGLASAYQFAQTDAKSEGRYFKGFPSYWNVLAVYLLVLHPAPSVALAIVAVLCLLVFVPLYYVYPTRTPVLRRLTLALGSAWGAAIVTMVWLYPNAPGALVWGSLAYPLYYLALSIWVSLRRRGCR